MKSSRDFPLGFQYDFKAPFGVWRARLDHKAWGKSGNIILYFTQLETGAKYGLSVYWDDGYAPRDKGINFKHGGEVGGVFELTVKPTKTGKLAFIAAREISPNEPPAPNAPEMAAGQGRVDSAPEKPAARPPRKAWGGKYDNLDKPEGAEL
jgi:hypothetical protein